MVLKYIKRIEEFHNVIKENKLVCINFTTTKPGPYENVGPQFVKLHLDNAYPNVSLWKIDEYNFKAFKEAGITSYDTFQFYKDGSKVEEVITNSIEKVKEMIEKNIK